MTKEIFILIMYTREADNVYCLYVIKIKSNNLKGQEILFYMAFWKVGQNKR